MKLIVCRSAIRSRYVTICYSQHSCKGIKIRFIHSLRVLERLHAELRPSHTEVPNAPNRQVECSTMPLQTQPFASAVYLLAEKAGKVGDRYIKS